NESQIHFVSFQLDRALTDILNNTINLKNISQAFNNRGVTLNSLRLQPPVINNITDLKPYVNCTKFASYTAEIIDGQWQCVGHCKTNPDYCHQHGQCLNDINKGPVCRCFNSSLKQFYGPRCDVFHWGPGFYGALFGSLAVALLLLIIIITIILVRKKYTGVWKRSNSYNRRLSTFSEDFFGFYNTGDHNLEFTGT
uniref:mucin-3B n=1 Tax=Monopterus albus TaxID=43700 RepID=UPI0009B3F50B